MIWNKILSKNKQAYLHFKNNKINNHHYRRLYKINNKRMSKFKNF
jgi:hypothetical protein